MKAQNEKSLFHFILDVMDKVVNDDIDEGKVKSVCALSKEAQKLLAGERDRVKLMMQIDEHERNFGKRIQLRELAAIGFSDTTKNPDTGNPRLDDASYCK